MVLKLIYCVYVWKSDYAGVTPAYPIFFSCAFYFNALTLLIRKICFRYLCQYSKKEKSLYPSLSLKKCQLSFFNERG